MSFVSELWNVHHNNSYFLKMRLNMIKLTTPAQIEFLNFESLTKTATMQLVLSHSYRCRPLSSPLSCCFLWLFFRFPNSLCMFRFINTKNDRSASTFIDRFVSKECIAYIQENILIHFQRCWAHLFLLTFSRIQRKNRQTWQYINFLQNSTIDTDIEIWLMNIIYCRASESNTISFTSFQVFGLYVISICSCIKQAGRPTFCHKILWTSGLRVSFQFMNHNEKRKIKRWKKNMTDPMPKWCQKSVDSTLSTGTRRRGSVLTPFRAWIFASYWWSRNGWIKCCQ